MSRGPDFFIIGTAKAGTTSLASYLSQHPDIFIPPLKEPNYFALRKEDDLPFGPAPKHVLEALLYNWSELDRDGYYGLFAPARGQQVAGEASVRYLYVPGTAARIRAEIADPRFIAVLREPVERMFSHYNMNRQQHLEPLSFDEAIEAEPDRISSRWGWDWHYAAASRYAEQLKRYVDEFGRESLLVLFYEDLLASPLSALEQIYAHVGAAPGFVPDMRRRGKVAYRSRFPRLDKALTWPHPAKARLFGPLAGKGDAALRRVAAPFRIPAPRMGLDVRQRHAWRFREANSDLADLLGRGLPWQAH